MVFSTNLAEEERIGSIFAEVCECYGELVRRIGEQGVRRLEVLSRISDQPVLPRSVVFVRSPERSSAIGLQIDDIKTGSRRASRDEVNRNIRDMEVVVTVGFRGLAIESNLNVLSRIGTEVELSHLSFCRSVDTIESEAGTGTCPFA